ncbi:hypothetical protein BWI93_05910 [Siphonobacter sp. BAB-5385]|uniref:tetratricopeptide repeat protein n=1 Tax=Siphonobacter sp. BAB-5385 TaxID=1864822 RepID=UPI000B9EA0C5|nr:tetratricopeptide repeat protein [Siphonobacter sp. BAB-5385]OZI09038.1 hypothetical protein BWI93_05910 [Siphonobacter sp. BAB-5385]
MLRWLVFGLLFVVHVGTAQTRTDSLRKLNNLAAELAKRGRYDRAAPLLKGALQVEARDTLRYNMALVELAQGHPDQAKQWLTTSLPFANVGLQKGLIAGQQGRFSEALTYFRTTPATPENSDALFYNQAIALWRSAPEKADVYPHIERYLQQSVSTDPKSRLALGQLMAAQNRWDEAVRSFQQARQDGADTQVLLRLGHAHLALNQPEEALQIFQEYLDAGGREGYLAHLGMAYTHYRKGDYAAAGAAFQRVLRIRPNSAEAATGMGHILIGQHLDGKALAQYQRALSYDSTYAPGRLGRAMAYYRLGRYAEAWKDFAASAHIINPDNPDYADFYLCRGFTLIRLKKYRNALTEFENAQKSKPNETAVYAGLSEAYRGLGDFQLAHRNVNEALKREPNHAGLLTNRGNFQLNIEQFNDASDDYKRAIQLDPGNINAHNGVAITDLQSDRIPEALVRYDSLLLKNPRQPMLYNNRGITQSYRGLQLEFEKKETEALASYKKSLADFQRAMSIDTAGGYYRNNIGNVYRILNQNDKAVANYNGYLSKTAINNLGVLYAGTKQKRYSYYYITTALQLDSTNFSFLYNRAKLYRSDYPDSLTTRGKYLRAESFISPNAIARKYSKDGYITVYLFDYQYNTYEFEGQPRFPIKADAGKPLEFQTFFDFQSIPEPPKPEPVPRQPREYTYPKGKSLKSPRKSKNRGSTECPV